MRKLSITRNNDTFIPNVSMIDSDISLFLIQIAIIYIVCRILSIFGQLIYQPTVIFEIIGGIILGPSVLGKIPNYQSVIFPMDSLKYIKIVANYGLQIYLFLVGLEIDLLVLKSNMKITSIIAILSMTLPFIGGFLIAYPMYEYLRTDQNNTSTTYKQSYLTLAMFIGTAMSITALPVLTRILKENLLLSTKPGAIAFGAAIFTDALAWMLLVISISLSNATSPSAAGWILFAIIIYALIVFIIIQYVFHKLVTYIETKYILNGMVMNNLLSMTIIIMFLSAWITSMIGLEPIIGSFMIGVIIPRNSHLYVLCIHTLENFVHLLLLPIYFALSGLQTDFTSIKSHPDLIILLAVCLIATFGKVLGAGIPAYCLGISFRESMVIAVLMNTRGLVELIVLNIGLKEGVLNNRIFSIMVIMCLFTTFITSPILLCIYPSHLRRENISLSVNRIIGTSFISNVSLEDPLDPSDTADTGTEYPVTTNTQATVIGINTQLITNNNMNNNMNRIAIIGNSEEHKINMY